jgi:hypothetical protein
MIGPWTLPPLRLKRAAAGVAGHPTVATRESQNMEKPMITQMHGRAGQLGVRVILAIVSCIMLGAGCSSLAHPRDLRGGSVTLKRTQCEGICPAYSVTIDGSGLVQYLGEFRVDIPGAQTGRIPPERAKELLRKFAEIHFSTLKDKYFENCDDQPTAIITLTVHGKSKQVSNEFGGCERLKSGPQVDLDNLSKQIDSTAGTSRWVKCDFDCMSQLIKTGLNVNAQAPNGDTPLLIAVQQRDLRKTRLLLDAGAQVNAADNRGLTALMLAGTADKIDLVQELLARGADVNAQDKKGFTVLDMVAGGSKIHQALLAAKVR